MIWEKVFDYANSVLEVWPDGKEARKRVEAIPKDYPYREHAITLARRQWRMWEHSNFYLPWVTARKDDGGKIRQPIE